MHASGREYINLKNIVNLTRGVEKERERELCSLYLQDSPLCVYSAWFGPQSPYNWLPNILLYIYLLASNNSWLGQGDSTMPENVSIECQ